MNWTESLLGVTRAHLLALLRRSRRSINELAKALGVTDNAVRIHIAAMQRDGLVQTAGVERGTGGKPAQLYEITPEAEELFPKAYATVLSRLLTLLEERVGAAKLTELLKDVGSRAAAEVGTAEGGEDGVEAAASVLRALGGDVDVERTEEGWLIRGYACPLSAVTADHREVCALAETLVGSVAGMQAVECCDRGDRPRCAFHVRPN